MSEQIKPFKDIFQDLVKTGFIAYCGAGISIPAPTCAPSWWTLTEEILMSFFRTVPEEYGLPKDLIIKEQAFQPEAIFEVMGNIFGPRFYETFKALDVSQPNANHKLIARLAKAKILKACFTTNFDLYIERALKEEGVDYQLLVENDEYDVVYNNLIKNGLGDKFLVCKIHGTVDRPDSIIAVASAYKSLKGFSPSKSRVYQWLLEKYSCLFLGYAGWDFEHINYRKFWDRSGPKLKGIFWNRRVGETGGPKFPIIFNSCAQKFVFSELDLPNGWIEVFKSLQLTNVSDVGIVVLDKTTDDNYWKKAREERLAFFDKWSRSLPADTVLSAVIAEGTHFSAKFKASRDKVLAAGKKGMQAQAGPDPKIQAEMQTLGLKLATQEIDMATYQKRQNELQMEMMLWPLEESKRGKFKEIALAKYPNLINNPGTSSSFVMKAGALAKNYDIEEALKIAADMLKTEGEVMMKGGNSFLAETMVNGWLISNMHPTELDWKEDYKKILEIKNKFISGEIANQQDFQKKMQEVIEKKQYKDAGLDVPIDKQIDILVKMVSNANTKEDLIRGMEAFNISLVGVYARINAELFKSPEYKALNAAAEAKAPAPAVMQVDPMIMQKKYDELGKLLGEGKITAAEFQTRAVQISMEATQTAPVTVAPAGAPPEIPQAILDTYDAKIRAPYQAVYDKLNQLFPEPISFPRMLFELVILSLWIAGTQMIYTEKSKEWYPLSQKGLYPIIESHPSIVKYLYAKHKAWIDQGFDTIGERFGHTLCRFATDLAEMANDLDLCKRAADKALEYEAGKVDEETYMKITISIGSFYEQRGDKANALKYYNIGLDSLRSAFIPPFADILVYRCALLTAETDKLTALKMLILGFPEYLGNEPPMQFAARPMGMQFTEKLAAELGYGNVKQAMQKLFEA